MSFATMKKNRKKITDTLREKAQNDNSKVDYNDAREWKLKRDNADNGYAIIRFLPTPDQDGENGLPWVKVHSHSFKGPTGKFFIENCRTSIAGEACPVCEENTGLWDTGIEANKNIARDRKRKLNYYSNIYVVQDKTNPENEGKVFLFRYGKKIFDKLNEAMHPEFEDEEPIIPFDLWDGANFKLKCQKKDGFINYDKSSFDKNSEIADDDDQKEAIWKQCYSLQDYLKEDNFKSYNVLKEKFLKVTRKGGTTNAPTAESHVAPVAQPVMDSSTDYPTEAKSSEPEGETLVDTNESYYDNLKELLDDE